MDILREQCIVLNRNWQAVNSRSIEEAVSMIFAGAATMLDVQPDGDIVPVTFEQWMELPLRPGLDVGIKTSKRVIREPRVIVAVNYAKVPKRRPKLCAKAIRERERNRCAYTGKLLRNEDGSLDHVVPRSKGGKDSWENLVWSDKKVNESKRDRTPEEAGLKLLVKPKAPLPQVPSATIKPSHSDHEQFLIK